MNKRFFYYCLAVSLVLHLMLVYAIRLKPAEKTREKEPIAIDLAGPLKWGPTTNLPVQPLAQAIPPPPPTPAPHQPPVQASPPTPAPGPVQQEAEAPPSAAEAAAAQPSAPVCPHSAMGSAPPCSHQAAIGDYSHHHQFVKPTQDDLERYAMVDKDNEKVGSENSVTLDTRDLMYTAYLQGLKNRIELIWKYPESARQDGIQGDLVMKFSISKSGRVESVELIRSSGYPQLDDAAKRALMDADPFNPLPDNWKKDSFTITGTFVYRLYGLYLR